MYKARSKVPLIASGKSNNDNDDDTFQVVLSKMTIPKAKELAKQLSEQDRYTSLALIHSAYKTSHVSAVKIFLEAIVQLAPRIHRLALAAPLAVENLETFSQALVPLKCLILRCSVVTAPMARRIRDVLAQNNTITTCFLHFEDGQRGRNIVDILLDSFARRSTHLDCLIISADENISNTQRLPFDWREDWDDRPPILAPLRRIIQNGLCPRELEITHVEVMDEDIEPLEEYLKQPTCRLEELEIRDVVYMLYGAEFLSEGLRFNQSMRKLFLRDNQIEMSTMDELSVGLGQNKSISHLSLSGNHIDDDCIYSFCEEWHPDSRIQILELDDNLIEDEGAEIIVQAILKHPNLQKVKLDRNKMGFEGLKVIGQALPQMHLKSLDVSFNIMQDHVPNDKQEEEKLLQEVGTVLLKGIQSNTCLQEFSFQGFPIPDRIETEIQFFVELNQMGRYLLEQEQQSVPHALWPLVFGKRQCSARAIFFHLQKQPHILLQEPGTNAKASASAP